jgi:hypothetical protein
MGKAAILRTPEALDSLVRTLILPSREEDTEEVEKEQALMCLGNLSVDGQHFLLYEFPDHSDVGFFI